MSDFEEILSDIRSEAVMTLECQDVEELRVLCQGGCNWGDYADAYNMWTKARRVREDWPYIRTVMLKRRAEKNLLLAQAQAEART